MLMQLMNNAEGDRESLLSKQVEMLDLDIEIWPERICYLSRFMKVVKYRRNQLRRLLTPSLKKQAYRSHYQTI